MRSKNRKYMKIDRTTIKKAMIITLVIFIIGFIFKVVDKSLSTWNYNQLIESRDHYNFLAHTPGIPQQAKDSYMEAFTRYDNGAKDQLVGVAIGWPLIGLKILIYGLALKSLRNAWRNLEAKENMFFSLMFSFIRLAIGLTIGETITIWLTERNAVEHTPRVIYSFISPILSIFLASGLSIYFYKLHKKR